MALQPSAAVPAQVRARVSAPLVSSQPPLGRPEGQPAARPPRAAASGLDERDPSGPADAISRGMEPPQAPRLFVLMGLPGAGKSTWTEHYRQTHANPVTVINMDACYEAYATSHHTTYRQAYLAMVAQPQLRDASEAGLTEQFLAAAAAKHDIIVDRTNMALAHRSRWLALVPVDYQKVGVIFTLSQQEALARSKARFAASNKEVPEFVYSLKADLFAHPSAQQEFDQLIYIEPSADFRLVATKQSAPDLSATA